MKTLIRPLCAALTVVPSFTQPLSAAVISGNYYEDRATTSCSSGPDSCNLNFALTPADKFLTITNVYCHASLSAPLTSVYIFIMDAQGQSVAGRTVQLPISPTVAINSSYILAFDASILFKLGPSRIAVINFAKSMTNSNGSLNCTIVGTLSSQ